MRERFRMLVVVSCSVGLFSSGCGQPASNGAAPAPASSASAKQVTVEATLQRTSFYRSLGLSSVSSPSWTVKMSWKNPTDRVAELGESLVVIEQMQDGSTWLACHVTREKQKDSLHLRDDSVRYGLDWGYEIGTDGSYFQMLGDMFTFASTEVFDGLGYGRVAPGDERTLEVEVIFPLKAKEGKLDYVAVVTPSITLAGDPPARGVQHTFRFAPDAGHEGPASPSIEATTIALEQPTLVARARDASVPPWQRLFALNWLAETHPAAAVPVLMELAGDDATERLARIASVVNLGHAKVGAAAPSFASLAEGASDKSLRRVAVEALGEIGDSTYAPLVRGLIGNPDERLSEAAMEAAGKLGDGEAVASLHAVVVAKKTEARVRATAATALGRIGGAARDVLVSILRDRRSQGREDAARALGLTDDPAAVPPLVEVASDAKADRMLRAKALASLGKLGGDQALATLRGAARGKVEGDRDAALDALGELPGSGGLGSLVEFATASDYGARAKALEVLGKLGGTAAAVTLRQVAADASAASAARREAVRALAKLPNAANVPALRAAADDSDEALYEAAVEALGKNRFGDAEQALYAALGSQHASVRRAAAEQCRSRPAQAALAPLWKAYQAESDTWAGQALAEALIASKLEANAGQETRWLVARLDPERNELWFSDVTLLRHLTGQTFGPDSRYGNEKERDAELAKWRALGAEL